MKIIKRILVIAIVAFALWYLIAHPQGAASAVQGAVGMVVNAVNAVFSFFSTLAGS